MPDFNLGDIIVGKQHNGYAYTSERALMLVTDDYDNGDGRMNVVILCHVSYPGELGERYDVKNSYDYFEHATLEEFLEKYPNCYQLDVRRMNELGIKYTPSEIKEEKIEPYVLSEEMRTELIEEMKELLTKYQYHPTDEALNKIIDEWCKNKGDLIRLFEKNPNYNGKFQITFDYDFDRVLDYNAINRFRYWLLDNERLAHFKKEVKFGCYTYRELVDICERLKNFIRLFSEYYGIEVRNINGKTLKEYEKELRHFRRFKSEYEYSDDVVITDSRAYDKESFECIRKIEYINTVLSSSSCLYQFVNDTVEDYLRDRIPEAKIKAGQKMSRAIGKVLRMIGADKLEDYNKEFAKFSDAINPLKIKRHTIISVHPVDYLTMSFGNSWSSCQTIDKKNLRRIDADHQWGGMSSSGTMSYMLDGTSSIFYTVDAAYDGNEYELQDKINRCMFHYCDNQLVQGRVYPQSNDDGANDLYRDIREIVQKLFADMLEVPNYWTNKSGCGNCCDYITSRGTHYRDYENFDNCNISILKDDRNQFEHKFIKIGHNPICPCCGEEHTRARNIECCNCNDME